MKQGKGLLPVGTQTKPIATRVKISVLHLIISKLQRRKC